MTPGQATKYLPKVFPKPPHDFICYLPEQDLSKVKRPEDLISLSELLKSL
jgi:hypothetical protein